MEKAEIAEEGPVIVLTQENYQQLLGKQVKILTNTEEEKVTSEADKKAEEEAELGNKLKAEEEEKKKAEVGPI